MVAVAADETISLLGGRSMRVGPCVAFGDVMSLLHETGGGFAALARTRRRLVTRSLHLLDAWGYREVEVPLLAPFEELRTAIGEERAEQLFRFVDRSGKLLVLRGDLTPVVARQFALWMANRPLPARLAYANRVARTERAFARQQTESYELGMELVGRAGVGGDLEVLAVALDLLDELAVPEVELHLGDVRILHGLVGASAIDPVIREPLVRALRLRDPWEVRRLCEEAAVPRGHREALVVLCRQAPTREDLRVLTASGEAAVADAVAAVGELLDAVEALGFGDRIHLDLSARDDRGYYTGMRFRIVCASLGVGVGQGGRYDRLYGHFGGEQPAVGFGLRVDRLVRLLDEHAPSEPPVVATVCRGDDPVEALREARRARKRGEGVLVELSSDPTSRQGGDS